MVTNVPSFAYTHEMWPAASYLVLWMPYHDTFAQKKKKKHVNPQLIQSAAMYMEIA